MTGQNPAQLDFCYTADDEIIIRINGQVAASRNVSGTRLACKATASALGTAATIMDRF